MTGFDQTELHVKDYTSSSQISYTRMHECRPQISDGSLGIQMEAGIFLGYIFCVHNKFF